MEKEVVIAGVNCVPEDLRAFGVDSELNWNAGRAELFSDGVCNGLIAGQKLEGLDDGSTGNARWDSRGIEREARDYNWVVEWGEIAGDHADFGEVEGSGDSLTNAELGGLGSGGVEEQISAGGEEGAALAETVAAGELAKVGGRELGAGGDGGLIKPGDDVGVVGVGVDFVAVE